MSLSRFPGATRTRHITLSARNLKPMFCASSKAKGQRGIGVYIRRHEQNEIDALAKALDRYESKFMQAIYDNDDDEDDDDDD